MDIYLSINNREEVIQLPVIPNELVVSSPMNNSTVETVSVGTLKIIGNRGLKNISLSSFFPVREYPFLRDRTYKGFEYVEKIEKWIDRRKPIRIIITDTPINLAMTIDSFEYGIKDGSNDVYYTLTLSEYRFIELNTIKR